MGDTRIAMGPEWQAIKEDPNSAPAKCFGSMPVIVHGQHMVAQSIATAQYAADLGLNKAKPPSASASTRHNGAWSACRSASSNVQVLIWRRRKQSRREGRASWQSQAQLGRVGACPCQ